MAAVRQKINKATGMGANHVEGLQLVVGGAPEIDCTDGDEVEFVPCIHARGKHWKLARDAVVGQRLKRGHAQGARGGRLAPQGVQKDSQTRAYREERQERADAAGEDLLEEIAPAS